MCERLRRLPTAAWPLLAAGALGTTLGAHEFSWSESTLEVAGRGVRVTLRMNLLEMAGVDANADGRVTYDELDRSIERVFAEIKARYVLRAPEAPLRIVAEKYQIWDDHVLQIEILHSFGADVDRLDVTTSLDGIFGPAHQHLLSVRVHGEPMRAVLDASNRSLSVDLARVTAGRVLAVALAGAGLLLLAVYRIRGWSRAGSRS